MYGGARQHAPRGYGAKKLVEAGRAWAFVEPGKDGTAEDREFIVLPAEPVSDQPDICYIDHENREAWDVFQGCCEQWVFKPMGGPICIDRSAIQSVLGVYGVKEQRKTFEKVLLIERGALAQMADTVAMNNLKTPPSIA
ncbi:MAG: DUF1799 domain-containing protein [Candidatus Reddybacter sp.]